MLHVFLVRVNESGALDLSTLQRLKPLAHGLVRYDVGPGTWRLISVWDIENGAAMRGLTPQQDDGKAFGPPAASVIHPGAVETFLRLTHDEYYRRFKKYFGSTIVAFWTDEPVTYARGSRWSGQVPFPFHPDLLRDLQREWDEDITNWLPALWYDCGPRTAAFRLAFDHALQKRVTRVYYARLGRWCEEHDIMLCGHPACDGEMAHLRHMQLPGQDLVHNYVAPVGREPAETQCSIGREEKPYATWRPTLEAPSAIAGPHSVSGKASSSVALIDSRQRNSTQFGAYGWKMTLDELKWLFDWHLVRGANLFFLSARYYSLRGRRVHQWNGPSMGANAPWYPYFAPIARHVHRLSWLLSDGQPVCDVAVLTDGYFVKWAAAAELFRAQLDFFYLYDEPFLAGKIEGNRLKVGQGSFRAIVCDLAATARPAVRAKLAEFQRAGGVVIESWTAGALASQLIPMIGQDLRVESGPERELRFTHYRKAGQDFYLLNNEGAQIIEVPLSLAATGAPELWDAMTGSTQPWPGRIQDGRLLTRIRLEPRQTLVLAVDPAGQPDSALSFPAVPGDVAFEIDGRWKAADSRNRPVSAPCPGDWAQAKEFETFTGTLRFQTTFKLPAALAANPLYLDLGSVGEIAEVRLNGALVGARGWAPYILPLGRAARAGANELEVRVTNSMANSVQGLQLPSGLLGPVRLRSSVLAQGLG